MAAFQYTAVDQQGTKSKGIIEADSAKAARIQLRNKKLVPIDVKSISEKPTQDKKSFDLFKRNRLSSSQLTLITYQMATLLEAGIPIDEMLTAVAEQSEKNQVKSVILGVRAKVLEGYSLAKSLDSFAKSFPKLYRTTVASGEKSGNLSLILKKLAAYIERQHKMKQKIMQALLYPLLMTAVSILIVIFLLIYVVPKIVTTFAQVKMTLPISTKILISISHFLVNYGIYSLVALITGVVLFIYAMKKKGFRAKVHKLLLKMPLIGNTLRTINEARFGRTLGILVAANVPILEGMHASNQLVTLLPMQKAIDKAIEQVREGSTISHALKKTKYFAPMFVYLVSSGEKSGSLESMLDHATTTQEDNVNVFLDNLLTLFEPVLILVMGGVVLFIVMAIMLPIFDLNQFNG